MAIEFWQKQRKSRSSKRNTIRIYHECEGVIDKSVSMITYWHHEACRVMTNGAREGKNFLSLPHTNNRLFFLLLTKYRTILFWEHMKNASRKS